MKTSAAGVLLVAMIAGLVLPLACTGPVNLSESDERLRMTSSLLSDPSPRIIRTPCGNVAIRNEIRRDGLVIVVEAANGEGQFGEVRPGAETIGADWFVSRSGVPGAMPVAPSISGGVSIDDRRPELRCAVGVNKEQNAPPSRSPLSDRFRHLFNGAMRGLPVTRLTVGRSLSFIPVIGNQIYLDMGNDSCTAAVFLAVAASQILQSQLGLSLEILEPVFYGGSVTGAAGEYEIVNRLLANRSYDLAHIIENNTDSSSGVGDAEIGTACAAKRMFAHTLIPKSAPALGLNLFTHELLHQIDGRHNAVKNAADDLHRFEPGEGTSVMSWAMPERYLHTATVDQVAGWFGGGSCGTKVQVPIPGQPTIRRTNQVWFVPYATPFELDTDGTNFNCVRWHPWDSGTKPGFPWFESHSSCEFTRFFPSLAGIQAPRPGDNTVNVEVAMKFIALVNSDPSETHGGLVQVRVVKPGIIAKTFTVNSVAIGSCSRCIAVEWEPADTTEPPFNVKEVSLELSIDGTRWVAQDVQENSGKATFKHDGTMTGKVMVRLKALQGIFFAVAPSQLHLP